MLGLVSGDHGEPLWLTHLTKIWEDKNFDARVYHRLKSSLPQSQKFLPPEDQAWRIFLKYNPTELIENAKALALHLERELGPRPQRDDFFRALKLLKGLTHYDKLALLEGIVRSGRYAEFRDENLVRLRQVRQLLLRYGEIQPPEPSWFAPLDYRHSSTIPVSTFPGPPKDDDEEAEEIYWEGAP
jgi:hypothetical protein